MKLIPLVACLAGLPAAAHAQSGSYCTELFVARGFAASPPEITDAIASRIVVQALMPFSFDSKLLEEIFSEPFGPTPNGSTGSCSLPQLAALTVDLGAMLAARPPEDVSALYGTWVSDNVLTEVAGLTLPGQEVLVIGPPIGPDPKPGAISITQDWYRTLAPVGTSRWTEGGDYTGRVVQGDLAVQTDGTFRVDMLEAPLTYSGATFLEERGEDLFVKSQINRFDGPVEFLIDGDVLVLNYRSLMPVYRRASTQTATYHRVAEGSPEAALRLVAVLYLSQARYFDCLTRKMSAGDPALAELLQPFGLDEVNAMTRDLIGLNTQRMAVIARQTGRDLTDGEQEAFLALAERAWAISQQLESLVPALEESGICPALDGLRIGF